MLTERDRCAMTLPTPDTSMKFESKILSTCYLSHDSIGMEESFHEFAGSGFTENLDPMKTLLLKRLDNILW